MRILTELEDPPAAEHAGGANELVKLAADHPGFLDPSYRARRDHIARLALAYRPGDAVPDVEYTEDEHEVWREVWRHLDPLHQRAACRAYLDGARTVALRRDRVPQLREVNAVLAPAFGFRMLPVAGLVSERMFLSYLNRSAFLSTQYMRHHSVPLYTPEPDVVHELVGHAATLAHPAFVALNRAFGETASRATEAQLARIGRVYWYSVEFGALREGSRVKTFAAGLLSSFGELMRFIEGAPLWPFDLEEMASRPYDPTQYQPGFFVADSFEGMVRDVTAWLAGPALRWAPTDTSASR